MRKMTWGKNICYILIKIQMYYSVNNLYLGQHTVSLMIINWRSLGFGQIVGQNVQFNYDTLGS